jgi:hypothetical protein
MMLISPSKFSSSFGVNFPRETALIATGSRVLCNWSSCISKALRIRLLRASAYMDITLVNGCKASLSDLDTQDVRSNPIFGSIGRRRKRPAVSFLLAGPLAGVLLLRRHDDNCRSTRRLLCSAASSSRKNAVRSGVRRRNFATEAVPRYESTRRLPNPVALWISHKGFLARRPQIGERRAFLERICALNERMRIESLRDRQKLT